MGTHLLAVQEFLHDHPRVPVMEPLVVHDRQPPAASG
jgi:hypothetical protein